MTNLLKKGFTVSVVVATIFWAVGFAAFLPFGASAAALADGDLIKRDGLSSVYYYANGARYVFPDQNTYFSWYSDFSGVKTVSQSELEAIPLATNPTNVVIRPGTKLVKITTDPKVYAVGPNGKIYHVDSEARATTLYGANWAQRVVDVPDSFFGNYTQGAALNADKHPAGTLVKYSSSASMYTVDATGNKRLFASMDAFNANRLKLSDVLTVSDSITYPNGSNVTAAESGLSNTAQAGNVVVGAGALTASLASDTPGAGSVPYNANNAAFTYVNLTAGSTAATVTGLKVTRVGLGTDANFSSVKLFVDGVQVGNSQSLNSAHQAVFSGISIAVPANSTKKVVLAGTIAATGTAVSGHLIGLSLNAATDVTSTASVGGTFPVAGNQMTVSSVTIGTATLANGSLHPSAATVDADQKDFRFSQVKVTAGGEDMTITQVTAVRNGTAGDADVANVELRNDTAGTTLGTATSLTNGRAVFSNLNIMVKKGENVELSVLADIVGGSGRTLGFDLSDGVAYLLMIKGNSYLFGVNPTGTFCTSVTGTCPLQTINQGYLTVQKSASTPATGNIAQGGSNVALGAFDFKAAGEPVNVTQTQVTITPASGGSASDYTNVAIYDASGNLVAGPQDGSTTTANTAQTLTFTDAFSIPVGTAVYYVKANLSSSAVNGEKVTVSLPANSITAKGANSGKTTYTTSSGTTVAPAAATAANQMTVQAAAMKVITAATPIAANMVANAQDQAFAYFDLDSTAGGEDTKVSQVIVKDTLGAGAAAADLLNLEMWGDPDNTDATTQNVLLETTSSTATNGGAAGTTFTFKTPIKVSHSAVSRLTLKADVASGASTGATATHTFAIDGATGTVTSVGWTTGNAITETYSGAGQAQTLRAVGLLQVAASADRAAAAQFVAGTTGNAMMAYKFTASYEDIDVTTFYIATTGATASANVARVKLYVNGTQVGSSNGYTLDSGGDAFVSLAPGTFVVPKDSNATLTIKVDLAVDTQLTDAATLEIGLGDTTGVDAEWGANGAAAAGNYLMTATGKQSGSTLTATNIDTVGDGTGTVSASFVQYLYDGVLTVSLNTSSPSGSATAGTNKEVARFDLTATGDDITINEMEFCVGGTATNNTNTPSGDVTLKSSDGGTTYVTLTQAVFDTYWDTVVGAAGHYQMAPDNAAGTRCFSFGDTVGVLTTNDMVAFSTPLEIAAGTTKTVKLYGDTTGAATNETIQVTLTANATNAATTSGVEWENSTGTDVDSALTKNLPVAAGSLVY